MAQDQHNWHPVKIDYVEGYVDDDGVICWPTLDQCAEKHGISPSTLKKRAANQNWSAEKEAYRNKLESARRERKVEEVAAKSAKFDKEVFRAAEAGLRHVQGHFLKAQAKLVRSEGREPMNLRYLNDLANALEKFQRIGRLSLGETTENRGGVEDHGNSYYLIQAIIGNPDNAERIKEHFRQSTAGKFSSE